MRPGFALTAANADAVAAICARVDGLPLAIELAAAKTRVLAPREILARLEPRLPLLTGGGRDQPARLQTMCDAIVWSYDLLRPDDRALLSRLSIFVGGFSLDAAEAICGEAEGGRGKTEDDGSPSAFRLPPSASVLEGLTALVDQSLVHQLDQTADEPYFTMLETIREYGEEHLAASGEYETLSRRRFAWCLTLAEKVATGFSGNDPGPWAMRLERNHDNTRAALSWLERHGQSETALRFVTLLEWLWRSLGFSRQGDRWLTWALARRDEMSAASVAAALNLAAQIALELGDNARAERLANESVERATAAGDIRTHAGALRVLGGIVQSRCDETTARALYEEALGLFREIDDRAESSRTLCHLATLGNLGSVDHPGDPTDQARATARCEEALRLSEAIDNQVGRARALHGLAYVAYKVRDYPRAVRLSRETLELRWHMRDTYSIPASFEDLGDIAGMTGHPREAARLYGAAEALRERLENPIGPFYLAEYERKVAIIRDAMSPPDFAAAWAAGRDRVLLPIGPCCYP